MRVALVTGASSGIGLAISGCLAQEGYVLVVVARRRERLENLGRQLTRAHGTVVHTVSVDLSTPSGPADVADAVRNLQLSVSVLVNCAGFGAHGEFAVSPLDQAAGMVDVNVRAVVVLTRLLMPDVLANRGLGHGLVSWPD